MKLAEFLGEKNRESELIKIKNKISFLSAFSSLNFHGDGMLAGPRL
jgi:hypothetical protein